MHNTLHHRLYEAEAWQLLILSDLVPISLSFLRSLKYQDHEPIEFLNILQFGVLREELMPSAIIELRKGSVHYSAGSQQTCQCYQMRFVVDHQWCTVEVSDALICSHIQLGVDVRFQEFEVLAGEFDV